MTLEEVLHTAWAGDSALVSLLPAEKLTTGDGYDATLPYARLSRPTTTRRARTNRSETIDEATVRIDVWHDRHDRVRSAAAAVVALYDNAAFNLGADGRAISIRLTEEEVVMIEDRIWQATLTFEALVWHA